MKEVPSDVIELIIGIDMNPKDPHPINVDMVDKGKGGDMDPGEWKSMCKQLLQVLQGPDSVIDDDNLADLVREAIGGGGMEKPEPKEDPFSRAAKKPAFEKNEEKGFTLKFGGGDDEKPKSKGGGFRAMADKMMGKEKPFPPKDDEDDEEEF